MPSKPSQREHLADYVDAREKLADLEDTFDLRWKADMRAIKAWQAAHPDKPLTWPDHADLVVWLAEQMARATVSNALLRDALSQAVREYRLTADRWYADEDGTPCWCMSAQPALHDGWVHAPRCLERVALWRSWMALVSEGENR